MQNLPIKFPNKKGILVSTPTLLKYMSLFLNKFKLGFGSDTYLPFGPKSRFLLFFFLMSSLTYFLYMSTDYVWFSVATKLRRSSKLRRFLSEDPSSSSSSVHFQMPKNLRSFEDFRPKIAKIFWENLTKFWTKLSVKV